MVVANAVLERLVSEEGPASLLAFADANELDAQQHFFVALVAFGAECFDRATHQARLAAVMAPDSRVLAASATYLQRVERDGKARVYVEPEAFGAFIRGGTNLRLYRATSAALQAAYDEHARARLLDIGVGDGMALLPALSDRIATVTLVEPIAAMLAQVSAALGARSIHHEAIGSTIQEYMHEQRDSLRRWDLAQATFSLQSVPAAERAPLWSWLRARVGRLLVVEFDVPQFASMYGANRVRHVRERYERGLAEYDGDELVVQGFLMPVMCGYFDRSNVRANYEQPVSSWQAEIGRVGFTRITRRTVDDYWWAPACLIDAR